MKWLSMINHKLANLSAHALRQLRQVFHQLRSIRRTLVLTINTTQIKRESHSNHTLVSLIFLLFFSTIQIIH